MNHRLWAFASLTSGLALACSKPPTSQAPPPLSASVAPVASPPPALSRASVAFACTLAAPTSHATPPTPPQDKSKEVSRACEKLEKTSNKIADQRKPKAKEDQELWSRALTGLGRCVYGPRGAWIFEVRKASDGAKSGKSYRELGPNEPSFAFDWELVHITPEGKELRGDVRGTSVKHGSLTENLRVDGPHDLDDDGVAELFFTRLHANTDEETWEKRSVIRAKGGKIEPYPGTEKMIIQAIQDEDGDGRVDLVLQSPFKVEGPCGLDGQTYYGPYLLAHTRPGGTFAHDDAVARAFVRTQCKRDPTLALFIPSEPSVNEPFDAHDTIENIACAVHWGLSSEQLSSRIRQDYPPSKEGEQPDGEGRCVSLRMLLQIASTKPPFLLDGCPGQ